MSTPAASGPSDIKDVDRRRSLGKYVKRMSSVFKREKPTTTASSSTTKTTPSPTAFTDPAALKPTKDIAAPAPAAPNTETTTAAPKPATSSAIPPPPAVTVHQINRSALQQERARLLFAKYGLTLESHEWLATPAQPTTVQRVEKPIRMRVHRECHHCGTSFGSEKVCVGCEHKRCKKCPRYPKKKSPVDKGKAKAKEGDHDRPERPRKKKVLTVTTKAGDERVYQPVKQRVRRSCHKCTALFVPANATSCGQCNHVRCTKCPRDPAKLTKWPHGYPGDVEPDSDTDVERDYEKDLEIARRVWRKPRTRVRWECEECKSQFIEGQIQCPGCGHQRCEKCSRWPTKRPKKDLALDPEVVRKVEAKLRALAVEQGSFATSGPGST